MLRNLKLESISAICLFLAVLLALIFRNTELWDEYLGLVNLPISITIGGYSLKKALLKWVNDGLMALFFLMLTLEAKAHLLEDNIEGKSSLILPLIAAIGGVIAPALMYCLIIRSTPELLKGWAVPIATDTAFVLGILSFFSGKVTRSLRLFVIWLSIIDDVIAVLVLGLFYTPHIFLMPLLGAFLFVLMLVVLNLLNVSKIAPYLLVGGGLWLAIVETGIHGTLAGVLIGICIPLRTKYSRPETPSPLKSLEHALQPIVTFGVLPLFAFLNSGISFKELSVKDLAAPLNLSIFFSLLIGKQIGVFGASFLAIKAGFCRLPERISWLTFYAICILCGIGFTFSLFIGLLSFEGDILLNQMKLGVILSSFVAALLGIILFWKAPQLEPVN